MPVPSSINDLNTTPGLNSPAGSESPATFDDYMRTFAAFIAQLRDGKASTTDAVLLTGNQTIAGVKTFSSTIVGSINGNAATATTAGTVSGAVNGANLTDNTVTPAKLTQKITPGTPVATTSGTQHDFAIPSWVNRVTLSLLGVSTNGTSGISALIGDSGGVATTGYTCTTSNAATSTAEFLLNGGSGAAAGVYSGTLVLTRVTGNSWTAASCVARTDTAAVFTMGGTKTLTNALSTVRLKTTNGTDTFDLGSANVLFE